MSRVVISPVVTVDTSSTNPQVVEVTPPMIGVAKSVLVV